MAKDDQKVYENLANATDESMYDQVEMSDAEVEEKMNDNGMKKVVKEAEVVEKKKSQYTHKRLRSAYGSLKRNLKHLFTYQKHPDLNIPNTTNSIEGMFSGMKKKLRNHAGLKKSKKFKILDFLLSK